MMFWQTLPRPFVALAPMAGVTDRAFFKFLLEIGPPDLFITELIPVSAFCSPAKEILLSKINFDLKGVPILLQLVGNNPEQFYYVAQIAREMGFSGIDINVGCPNKGVIRQKAGAYLLKTPHLIPLLVVAARTGSQGLPISLKVRVGFEQESLEPLLPFFLEGKPDGICFHWRTRAQMFKGKADWSLASKVVPYCRKYGKKDLVLIGNGDIQSVAEGKELAFRYGLDGVMIGRAAWHHPWIFSSSSREPSLYQKLQWLLRHLDIFEELNSSSNLIPFRKYIRSYVNDFPEAKEWRARLMTISEFSEMRQCITNLLESAMK